MSRTTLIGLYVPLSLLVLIIAAVILVVGRMTDSRSMGEVVLLGILSFSGQDILVQSVLLLPLTFPVSLVLPPTLCSLSYAPCCHRFLLLYTHSPSRQLLHLLVLPAATTYDNPHTSLPSRVVKTAGPCKKQAWLMECSATIRLESYVASERADSGPWVLHSCPW